MDKSITLIIQARMGSSRLPGKMLMPLLDNKSMLYWIVNRLQLNSRIKHLVVATSQSAEDLAIVAECKKLNIPCVQGSEWDVLSRFYQAALSYPADWIIRVCGDSPLINADIIDFVIDQKIALQCDYFSNGNEPPQFVEDGFCAEIFDFAHLQEAFEKADWLSEREHVTPYIKKNKNIIHAWAQFRKDYRYKLSVDTLTDFQNVQWIFNQFKDPIKDGINEVMYWMTKHPQQDWGHIDYNAGYQKSVTADKKVEKDG
jgi:spore coat polysaccharide biosynthesis protein SpsF